MECFYIRGSVWWARVPVEPESIRNGASSASTAEYQEWTVAMDSSADPMRAATADLSIAEALRLDYPEARFRTAFLGHPVLNEWTVRDILQSAASEELFLGDCRSLPQFGRTQETRLQAILVDLKARLGLAGNRAVDDPPPDDRTPLPVTGEFHPDFVSAWRAVYQRAWQLAHFDTFIYIPSSVPEFAKHPDVLRAEIGSTTDLSQYVAENAALRRSLPGLRSVKGVMLLDRARLDMIFQRRGRYAGLGNGTIAEQRHMLQDMIIEMPGTITTHVCDVEQSQLSCGSVVGDMVTLSAMGGYLVTQDSRLKSLITARCRDVARHAPTLADYLGLSGAP